MKLQMLLRQLAWLGLLQYGLVSAADTAWSPQQSELISLSDAWITAEVDHDKGELERILDERFVATFASSGKTINRSDYISWIMKSEMEPFTVQNEVIIIHGDSAVVISIMGTTKFTWIAVKKRRQWVVISETFSKITEKP